MRSKAVRDESSRAMIFNAINAPCVRSVVVCFLLFVDSWISNSSTTHSGPRATHNLRRDAKLSKIPAGKVEISFRRSFLIADAAIDAWDKMSQKVEQS